MPIRQVCGLDVHKYSVFVCILNENGDFFQEKYGALTPELEQMLAKMLKYQVEEVCMDSTSIYWMPVWRVLTAVWYVIPLWWFVPVIQIG